MIWQCVQTESPSRLTIEFSLVYMYYMYMNEGLPVCSDIKKGVQASLKEPKHWRLKLKVYNTHTHTPVHSSYLHLPTQSHRDWHATSPRRGSFWPTHTTTPSKHFIIYAHIIPICSQTLSLHIVLFLEVWKQDCHAHAYICTCSYAFDLWMTFHAGLKVKLIHVHMYSMAEWGIYLHKQIVTWLYFQVCALL